MRPFTREWHWDLIGLNLGLLLIAALIASETRARYVNALERHPAWESTKRTLGTRLIGANRFVTTFQPMTRNRLNLGAWFGFQEVLFKREVDLSELRARVAVEPEGYVNVLYDVRAGGFSGVRVSNRADLPSIHFHATPEGRFLTQAKLAAPSLTPNRVHEVTLAFRRDSVAVLVDARTAGVFAREPGAQRIGFRGGHRWSWVYDVTLRQTDGGVIRESFANRENLLRRTVLVFASLTAVVGGIAAASVRALRVPTRSAGLAMVMASTVLVVASASALAYKYFAPVRYAIPDEERIRTQERQMVAMNRENIPQLLTQYAGGTGDPYRILFLGASQTFGAGASSRDVVWVRQLERLLNADSTLPRIECVNGALSALTSVEVLQVARQLIAIRPKAVVVNLANNDLDTTRYRAHIDSTLALFGAERIPVVLLQEANSPERRPTDSQHGDLLVKHRILAELGRARAVPVVDMHHYLAERNATGFLWWDFVHLTDYGQTLLAEKLYDELPVLLGMRRRIFAQRDPWGPALAAAARGG